MSVLSMKAKIECDDCGGPFEVSIDPAANTATPFDAAIEAMQADVRASCFEGVMRCETCTGQHILDYIRSHPKRINGKRSNGRGGWLLTTYDDTAYEIAGRPAEPQMEGEIADHADAVELTADESFTLHWIEGNPEPRTEVDVIYFDGSPSTDLSDDIDWTAVRFWRVHDVDGGHCLACQRWFKADDLVLFDVSGDYIHAACCGPERESYVKDVGTGEPLGPDDPIPTGVRWDSLASAKPEAGR